MLFFQFTTIYQIANVKQIELVTCFNVLLNAIATCTEKKNF